MSFWDRPQSERPISVLRRPFHSALLSSHAIPGRYIGKCPSGTAVPSASQLAAVKHYFIHTHTVQDLYTAGKYEIEALDLIRSLFDEGHETLVMAGGSGFYIDAVCNGLDDFPPADQSLRSELTERLASEGWNHCVLI